ncbi:DinB family protein [Candidatus Palauibacter sp.]|uniref:DinB family protein n=1 Tax=Candidatus Palauibacter sp. TaxID=3101350 RepID=UPI003D115E81
MTCDALLSLLDFHYRARDGTLDAVEQIAPEDFRRDLGSSFGSIRDTLAHVVSAEWVWCSRWEGHFPTEHLPADDFETVGDIRARWLKEETRVRRFVAGLAPEDIHRVMEYRFFDGETMRVTFRHMLQHVVNHATYHRGQVTTMLRQLGADPPRNQGLIGFYLEQA